MKNLKTKIKERLSDSMDWIEYGLHRLYGKPTMMKQFIIVLILGSALSVFSIYTLIHSIYNMGRIEAGKEWMEIKHSRQLELSNSKDSINILNKEEHEYEQSNGGE